MTKDQQIVKKIIEGIQEKKGKDIITVNLTKLHDAPCSYFVICQGDSKTQVSAVAASIRDYVREKLSIKPFAIDGMENAEWVALDYGAIIVHVFIRPAREFYNIEHLWADADLKIIANLD
ncbi:MAG: ribosome silencing factor [Paludibacter sp.]|jgi:ribosome-associated protein|nr:ribosome silencing factor [Paludibacter sp.]